MLTLLLVTGALLAAPQNPPKAAAAPACTVLTTQEVSSLIGQARPMTVTNAPGGSTCMLQNEDKIITVMLVNLDTVEAAKELLGRKKLIAAGQDVGGWTIPGYSSVVDRPKEHVAIVGIVKDKRFLEVKVLDVTQKASELSAKLSAVMKALGARF